MEIGLRLLFCYSVNCFHLCDERAQAVTATEFKKLVRSGTLSLTHVDIPFSLLDLLRPRLLAPPRLPHCALVRMSMRVG